jgi:hypothetical protein
MPSVFIKALNTLCCTNGGQPVLTDYAKCSGTSTLGANATLSKHPFLDGDPTCSIYGTVCSNPTTLSTNETFGWKKQCAECLSNNTQYKLTCT